MNPLEQVNSYLRSLESTLRWRSLARGAAMVALGALVATIALVVYANSRAFAPATVKLSQVILFLCVAAVLGFGLLIPLLRLNRKRAAGRAEQRFPEFNQRLVTFIDKPSAGDAFLELLASDTLEVASQAPPSRFVSRGGIAAAAATFLAAAAGLVWLIVAGPGYLGYGASLLWAGKPTTGAVDFYRIEVKPGDRTVRRASDQMVSAQLFGFQAGRANLYARYRGTAKWEQTAMLPQAGGAAHEFLFAGLPETVDYYVEANGVRSSTHTLSVIDMPSVRSVRVTYTYPKWSGLPVRTEEPGGDVRAVEGTEVELNILTDKPLENGAIVFDDGSRVPLSRPTNNRVSASFRVARNGMYHVAAIEKDEAVRLTEDYFVEAQEEKPPVIRIARPGRDARVNPIEEVTVAVEAEDDFRVNAVAMHYSVNGGPEKEVKLNGKGKSVESQSLLALEEFHLVPGDLVSVYATAQDARNTAKSEILFIEAQPYEREYSQSQQMGGGGGGGEQEDGRITQRQKEIIVATYNQLADRTGNKSAAAENARYLSDIQSKLRDQSRSLARRMQARQLSGSNQEFQTFTREMDAAAAAMDDAVPKLKTQGWRDSLQPEQKALQHLLRAEALRRQIQVAYGRGGGGGGGGGQGRDLESLFDLELDTEKNQYETGESQASEQNRQIDDAMQKLEQLARRQQELANQAKQQQTPQQRWEQEMLRREAEKLRQEMQQLARNQQQGQSGQQGQQGQSGQQGQGGQQGQSGQQGKSGADPRIERTVDRLNRAMDDMRRAGSPQQNEASQADARRAADRLKEASDMLKGLRQQESGNSVDDLAQRASRLAQQQRDSVERARQPGQTPESAAREKEKLAGQIGDLERDMQKAIRETQGAERRASSKVREALGDMQGSELRVRAKYLAEWYRRGFGPQAQMRENALTAGLDKLDKQMQDARSALGEGKDPNGGKLERALSQVERLREQLNNAARGQARGQQAGGQQAANGSERGGNQGQQSQQGQQGQQGQGQAPGQQPGTQAGGGGSNGDRGYGDIENYRTPQSFGAQGPINRAAAEGAIREGMRELSQLRQGLEGNPDVERQVQELIRAMQRLGAGGNPRVLEQMNAELIPQVEQLETQLRRKLEEKEKGQIRTNASERVPPGYADSVAEYFRRLSRAK